MTTIPTVEQVLTDAHDGNGFYHWDTEGGRVTITKYVLLAALRLAYDPTMPDWPATVEIPDA